MRSSRLRRLAAQMGESWDYSTPFVLRSTSRYNYKGYMHLCPFVSESIRIGDIASLEELWQVLDVAPKPLFRFAVSALQNTSPDIAAAFFMAVVMAAIRNPSVAVIVFQQALNSADCESFLRSMLEHSFVAFYSCKPDSWICVKDMLQTAVRLAYGERQHLDGMTDGGIMAFPARELVQWLSGKDNCDWQERWRKSGGRIVKGRMVALKNDPVWVKLSRFGRPFPPFDWNSVMGVMDVDRSEAIRLGLVVVPSKIPATHGTEKGMSCVGKLAWLFVPIMVLVALFYKLLPL